MTPERFETWLTVDRKGLYCRPGGFHIDPYGGAKRAVVTHGHSDHARPGHDHVLATRETLGVMQVRLGQTGAKGKPSRRLRRARVDRRCRGYALPGRACARQRTGPDRMERRAGRGLRRLQAEPGPDLPRLRACPLPPFHYRGDVRVACVPTRRCERGSGKAAQVPRAISRPRPCRRRLWARQMPAPDRASCAKRATTARSTFTARSANVARSTSPSGSVSARSNPQPAPPATS